MAIDQAKIEEFLSIFKIKFPTFENFSNPQFVEEEVDYKHKTIEKAKELLSKETLSDLLDEHKYDEFISRINKIGRDNNLLWSSVPLQGDLSIIYDKGLDKPSYCSVFFELLYGEGNSTERLEHYLEYVRDRNLPNKWTFPTYFLFISNPEEEYFVKPETTKWFMNFIDEADKWQPTPNPSTYLSIRSAVYELKDALASYKPQDIVDVQGFIWVCHSLAKDTLLTKEKYEEFKELYQEFITTYPISENGKHHIQKLKESREIGKNNFDEVKEAAERGEDITNPVLLKLLPYSDTKATREVGAWIYIAPVINLDIKKWFEGAGWAESNDWQKISNAIFSFVDKSLNDPDQLEEYCKEFSSLPYIKGIQSGFLSPILNATLPEEFKIVNSKPVKAINYFTGKNYTTNLTDYPILNKIIKKISEELSEEMHKFETPDIHDDDLFDMFSHWLVAVKKLNFRKIQYWKIAPGEYAMNWEECKNGSYISIGWGDLGDISEMNQTEYISHRDQVMNNHPTWNKTGVDQVWRFARQIKEDDYIIANRGTSEVLGIGRVTGSYYYVHVEDFGHRLPVDWIDLDKRQINEPGWRRTLIKLDEQKYKEISGEPVTEPASPPTGVKEEAKDKYGHPFQHKTFELLEELHQNPTRDLYSSKIEDFKTYVINPMRNLFLRVADELPDPIKDLMETKSKIFSRISKNDFGRGGAWDYYWGAFYPKGGKRTEDAQLSIWINRDRFEYGFYIGEYGSKQRMKFLKNCKDNFEVLQTLIKECLDDDSILYGTRDELATTKLLKSHDRTSMAWDEWLKNPEESGIDVSGVISKDGILQLSETELTKRILEGFTRLFPLVLLATSDNPIPAINDYLEQIDIEIELEKQPIYSLSKLANETSIEEEVLQRWIQAIERKKQAILYGPPGTGKTYVAKLLARHLIGGSDGFHDIVQFHPAYAYEDFMQGIRPQSRSDGNLDFKLVPGRFLDICMEAKKRSGKCVLIIDEINRANLARVFGELMYLLEYRDESIPLSQGEHLSIPKNVNLIGTMNTADRSIALVDHALRRRFAFLPLYPNFNILREFHKDTDFPVKSLIEILERLNAEIDDKHYHIGITFFLNKRLTDNIEDIWKMEIEPYLEEYFYDQSEKAKEFNWIKIKDKLQ